MILTDNRRGSTSASSTTATTATTATSTATSATAAEPLDWLRNNLPADWRINGQQTHFDWFQDTLETSDLFNS